MKPSLAIAYAMKKKSKKMGSPHEMPSSPQMGDEHGNDEDADMITRIMSKRKMMAEGGVVADEPGPEMDEHSADYDYLSSGDLDDSTTNSGSADGDELGNAQEDEDRHDVVSRIMKQRKMKNTNPRPA